MNQPPPLDALDFTLELDPVDSGLPDAYEDHCEPLRITGAEGRAFVFSDTHFPYYDKTFIEYIADQAKKHKARYIIHLGDMHDFHRLSRFKKYKSSRATMDELGMSNDMWAYFQRKLGNSCEKFFVPGNHDQRFDDHVIEKVPELKDLPGLSLKSVTGWEKHGVKWADSGMGMSMNGLLLQHGHENEAKFSCASKTPAGRLVDKSMCDVVIGHVHATDEAHRRTADGRDITCYTLGCTSTLSPGYCRYTHWCHGFAVIDFFKNGSYRVSNLRRKNGMMV